MVFPDVTFQCGRYGLVRIWENDPEKCVMTQFMNGPLAYVFVATSQVYMRCYNSSPVRIRSAVASFSYFFVHFPITIHAYNKSYYVRHKLESIKAEILDCTLKIRWKFRHLQDSYLQSAGYESRVLTNTPRGQRDFGAKSNKRVWALKFKVFGESMLKAWYSALWLGRCL